MTEIYFLSREAKARRTINSKAGRKGRKQRAWISHFRPVTIDGVNYDSIRAAADHLDMTHGQVTFRVRCDKRSYPEFRGWQYTDGKKKRRVRVDSIIIKGKYFKHLNQAAEVHGMSSSRLCQIRKKLGLPG